MVHIIRRHFTAGLLLPFLVIFLISGGACTPDGPENTGDSDTQVQVEKKETTPSEPINFETISGTWELKYANNYGYTFRFYKNYRSIVILYLNNHALVFKGVYTFEGSNLVRINIYEMKKSKRLSGINLRSGFIKAKSSFFKFSIHLKEKNRKKILSISPRNITIDGNNSDGYFEPVIKLKRRGR